MTTIRHFWFSWLIIIISIGVLEAQSIKAGVGKANITNAEPGAIVNDSLYVKALVVEDARKRIVMITIDVVALEKIGHLPDHYLSTVREELKSKFGINPHHVIINASHCHGMPRNDVINHTITAVAAALKDMEVVEVGINRGEEDRISINRRLKLKNGKERDIRHAYSLPPDEDIQGVGVIDTEIGILNLIKRIEQLYFNGINI